MKMERLEDEETGRWEDWEVRDGETGRWEDWETKRWEDGISSSFVWTYFLKSKGSPFFLVLHIAKFSVATASQSKDTKRGVSLRGCGTFKKNCKSS